MESLLILAHVTEVCEQHLVKGNSVFVPVKEGSRLSSHPAPRPSPPLSPPLMGMFGAMPVRIPGKFRDKLDKIILNFIWKKKLTSKIGQESESQSRRDEKNCHEGQTVVAGIKY